MQTIFKNKRTIQLHIITTTIIVVFVGFIGGTLDILQVDNVVETARQLGYPLYFFVLLGVFKILGAIILLLPRAYDNLKIMAYSGFTFDFIFASFSHFTLGDENLKVIIPLVFLLVLSISYNTKEKV